MKRSSAIEKLGEYLHSESEANYGLEWWKIVSELSVDYMYGMMNFNDWDEEDAVPELPVGINPVGKCPIVKQVEKVNADKAWDDWREECAKQWEINTSNKKGVEF